MKKTSIYLLSVLFICILVCILPVAAQPSVSSTDPSSGATGVLGNPTITVTFDKSISDDSSHPLTGTITVNDGSHNIGFDYAWAYADKLTFGNWVGPWLAPNTEYTVTISGFKDLAGNSMISPYSWTFKTGADTAPPTVTSTDPAVDGMKVPVDIDAITLTFSEPIVYAPAVPNDAVSLTEPYGIGTYPFGTITVIGNTMTISNPSIPDPWFNNWQYYYVTVMGRGVKDSAGNELVDGTNTYYRFHFKTVSTDTTPPSVVSTNPVNGATNVPLGVIITATMDGKIGLCDGPVTMVDSHGNSVALSNPPYGYTSPDYIQVVITPLAPLVVGETYTVTLHGLKDGYDNVMPDYSWSFSTTGIPPTTEIATQDSYSTSPRCGWFNTSVQVTLSATGHCGSGIAKTEYKLDGGGWIPYGGPFTIDNEGITKVTYHSIDNDGNSESPQSLDVRIDKTPPTITGAVIDPGTGNPLPPNANSWYSSSVTVRFTIRDALSGILGDGGPGVDHYTDVSKCTEGANQFANMTVQDMPGSPATATLQVNIDKTPPSITINTPINCANYILNENVIADWSAIDSLAGIATQSGTTPTGSAFNTATVGSKQFTVTATDMADNLNTKTVSYTVDSQADATKQIIATVDGLTAPPRIKTALTAELNGAVTALTNDRPRIAKAILRAVNLEVKVMSGKQIPADQAAMLIAQTQRIIATI